MRSLQQFWSVRRIGEDRVTLARLGSLRIWLARASKEWGYASEWGEPVAIMDIAQVPEDVVPSGLAWANMLFRDAPREYSFRPAVPDRPVVVKPAHPVSIPPGESGTFYARMPVFIQIVISAGREDLVLGSVASSRLSDTWFGDATEGDLCYSLPDPADLELDGVEVLPHQIVYPLEVHNRSDEVLQFQKLCLRPRHAGLFCGDSHLWGGVVRIHHEGLYKNTVVRYTGSAPAGLEGLVEVLKPQKREERGLHRLTFGYAFSGDFIIGNSP